MDETLLSYYNRELAYLRRLGAEFAEKHPKIAGRLRLDSDIVEDPHVSRLIESFAFLTARIRHKLDDSFPELTEALMGLLHPDYLAPIPSMSIVQFRLVPFVTGATEVPKGTALATEDTSVGRCHYQTCYDTKIYPLTVAQAKFNAQPFNAPSLGGEYRTKSPQAMLQVTLQAHEGTRLSDIDPGSLRFYLSGQPQLVYRLYEFLVNNAVGVAVAEHFKDPEPVILPAARLRAVGIQDEHSVLPFEGRSAPAQRLLAEYFTFPEKFLFVELTGLDGLWERFERTAELYIYFNQSHAELVQGVSADTLRLGCTPIVNLFEDRVESILASSIGHETKLVINATHTPRADVHTIKRVYARNANGEVVELEPFYGAQRDGQVRDANKPMWHIRREASQWFKGHISRGIDTYLALVDDGFRIISPGENWVINADALCTNRDLPDKLPFGPDEPKLQFYAGGGSGLTTKCLTAPTPTINPKLDDATRWQLIAQLSLQHFSQQDGLEVLKSTLHLYNFTQAPEIRAMIDGILSLSTRLVTARVTRERRAAICQGTELTVELDETYFSGSGVYLFASILNEFFARYCEVNSFSKLVVKIKQRLGTELRWPPRSGTQTLI